MELKIRKRLEWLEQLRCRESANDINNATEKQVEVTRSKATMKGHDEKGCTSVLLEGRRCPEQDYREKFRSPARTRPRKGQSEDR